MLPAAGKHGNGRRFPSEEERRPPREQRGGLSKRKGCGIRRAFPDQDWGNGGFPALERAFFRGAPFVGTGGAGHPFRTVFVLTGAGAFLAGRTPRALCGCCRAAFNVLASGPGPVQEERLRASASLRHGNMWAGPSWRGRAEGAFTASLGPAAFRKAEHLPEAEKEGVRRLVPAGHDDARGPSPHHS